MSRHVLKSGLSLVVAARSGDNLRTMSLVTPSGSILVTTDFVSNRHGISLWLGYDQFLNVCHGVVQNRYVDRSRTVV